MPPITIRKTLARLSYYASKIKSGEEHNTILKSMGFTEEDFQYMIDKAAEISNTGDYDLDVVLCDHTHKSPIGGCYITKDGLTIAWI
jgi:hypothetical protein